ncbi:LysE family translocator [Streptomyces atacamensis]|jgi:threonine/homoserine/homoserine lactone efflux protein|uniref:LysE family translocator n=1 Tax=Streptomyces atacamensis TaxID=531966 RepID=UPI00399D216D
MLSVNLAGFLGVVLLAYLVPGPDFLVIVRAAVLRPALGRAAALGAQTGLCVHMLAAALGLSVIAARSPAAFTAIKLAGAAYLVHLGVRALIAVRRSRAGQPRGRGPSPDVRSDGRGDGEDEGHDIPWRGSFVQGLLTNILNPKAALFFLSVLPQFVDRGGPMTEQVFFLGVLDVVIGVVYWLALVNVAARLRTLLNRPAFRHRWEATTGWLFIAIGVGLATVG